jgi:quinohemoprotein amine dehydrogenase
LLFSFVFRDFLTGKLFWGLRMKGLKAALRLALVVGSAALLVQGCGQKKAPESTVKMVPRLSEAELAAGHDLIAANCGACHTEGAGGRFSRISYQRKTPEGWDMTIVRMINFHGLSISADDRRSIVKYLANQQGLAPSETAAYRYALERKPDVQELGHDVDTMHMCARCHSYARFALQRRDADEWRLLAHMHLGQWPSAEYQMYARERDWWADATTKIPEQFAKSFAFSTPAWEAWKSGQSPVMDGSWRVTGHTPGKGDYQGMATITTGQGGNFNTVYDLTYASGAHVTGGTTATVFTGYEWRGQGNLEGKDIDEVYAISEDGRSINGRWFLDAADEVGGEFHAVRMDNAKPQIMSVMPAYGKVGSEVTVMINGVGLSGSVDLGAGVSVSSVTSDARGIVVKATIAGNAASGLRAVKVGSLTGPGFTVYNKVDSVKVTPEFAVARLGGNGGPIAPVSAQFEAVGYMNGPDGKPGTADDIAIGIMPAKWAASAHDATAAAMQDVKFAGSLSADGQFSPAGAGPNPERKFGGGNAGDLDVTASVMDGTAEISGKAHLIVSPQRWNMPPIR